MPPSPGGRHCAGEFSLPPPRGPIPLVKGKCPEGTKGIGKVPPRGADEGGYRWVRRPSNGRMGTSAPTQGYDRFRRGRCPQRPVDNRCTPVVPLIRHGLRPCHLLPCGAKAIAVPSGALKCRWRSPHPSRLTPCHLPPGEGGGAVSKACSWLPLWGSWHGEAVTERAGG